MLIHAAAGGVGHFAVQLAKAKGARVIGTASKRNHDLLRMLGADELIDYTTTRFEDVAHDVDVVFDTMAGETQTRSWKVLKKGGILVSILSQPSEQEAAKHSARAGLYLSSRMLSSSVKLQNWWIRKSSGRSSKPFCRCRKRAVPRKLIRPAMYGVK